MSPPQPRILMYMPGLRPGSLGWQVHLDFAAAMRARGASFEMLTNGERDVLAAPTGELRVARPDPRWRWLSPRLAPLTRTRELLGWASALARYLRLVGHEVDLLHVEVAYPHGAAARLGARMAGWRGPIVITPMGEDVLVLPEAHYGFRRHLVPRLLVGEALRGAAALRCISGLALGAIRSVAPHARCEVIPLNVADDTLRALDPDPRATAARRREARAALASELGSGEAPLVLALGRLHPFKGIAVLVEAMRATRPDAELLLVGPSLASKELGDHAQTLLARARELGVQSRLRWLGAVEPARALALLRAADVLVVPSLLESLNKVCVEAAAVGTPFVVTSTTGIAEWVPPSGVGLVVPPGDPATLAATIDQVLDGGFVVDGAAQRGFVERFAPARVAAEVLRFYAGVLRR